MQYTRLYLLSTMQIKFCYKMAKNDGLLIFHANTTQENQRILQGLASKGQTEARVKEDFKKLFAKLNHSCRVKSTKEAAQNSSWYNKNVVNYTYGPVSGFPSGSWWGIRMDCSRDRVHDPFNEDVQNGPFGVTSVCTSSVNVNEDVDLGDCLTLTGQEYLEGHSAEEPLVKNYDNQIPVRLIRSYNLSNDFAPKTGYRYDGMYAVTNVWIGVNSDKSRCYKFALARLSDQEPPPWSRQISVDTKNSTATASSSPKLPKNCAEYTNLNTYEFRKYSHGATNMLKRRKFDRAKEGVKFADIESAVVAEKQKSTPESGIVTRHVFKKTSTNTESTVSPSTSSSADNKSLSQMGNQSSKAHSTNISIRTGLYDSSHSIQQDIKKNSLTTFYKASKPVSILKTSLHTEVFSMSNRDKSKMDGKTDALKAHNKFHQMDFYQSKLPNTPLLKSSDSHVRSSSETQRIDYNSTSTTKSVEAKSDLTKVKPTGTHVVTESTTAANGTDLHPRCTHSASSDTPELQNGKSENEITNEKREKVNTNRDSSKIPTNAVTVEISKETESIASKVLPEDYRNSSLLKESSCIQGLKSLESLDSLTPDKILHLINKEKYHPLSKLLMGNMIGLTAEQSVALQTYDELMKQPESKDKATTQKSNVEDAVEKKNFKATSEDVIGTRCYKFRRRKRLTRKMMNKSDVGKNDKALGNKLQKESTQPFDMLGQNTNILTMYPQTDTSKRDYLSRQNDAKEKNYEQTSVQGGSKSSKAFHVDRDTVQRRTRLKAIKAMKSTVKKHIHKKKRREIANLSIDAKIGPKVRGPRNRRLRSINNVYNKRSYDSFSTAICTLSKCKMGSEMAGKRPTFKTGDRLRKSGRHKRLRTKQEKNVKRSERLNLKHNRSHKSLDASVERTYRRVANRGHSKEQNLSDAVDSSDNNKKSKAVRASVKSNQTTETALGRSRKRKLVQTLPVELNYNGAQKHLQKNREKEAEKPCKMDAITQCSLITEESIDGPSSRNPRDKVYDNSEQRQSRMEEPVYIKVECNDGKDMKSEVYEEMLSDDEDYEDYQIYQTYPARTCNEKYKYSKDAQYNLHERKTSNVSYSSEFLSTEEQGQSPTERVSAFVPVNVLDSDLRIAQLRSIGFKPIASYPMNIEAEPSAGQSSRKCTETYASRVMKQDVAEKYNKYTNEENNVVVYMDEELQYQDIEDEDEVSLSKRYKASVSNASEEIARRSEESEERIVEKESCGESSLDQDLEMPWHGWKRVVTSEESYWIGW